MCRLYVNTMPLYVRVASQILVSVGALEPIPHRYRRMTVLISFYRLGNWYSFVSAKKLMRDIAEIQTLVYWTLKPFNFFSYVISPSETGILFHILLYYYKFYRYLVSSHTIVNSGHYVLHIRINVCLKLFKSRNSR
jgi:hypothetical protein